MQAHGSARPSGATRDALASKVKTGLPTTGLTFQSNPVGFPPASMEVEVLLFGYAFHSEASPNWYL